MRVMLTRQISQYYNPGYIHIWYQVASVLVDPGELQLKRQGWSEERKKENV